MHLECTKCGAHLAPGIPQNVCPKDGGILFALYDLGELKHYFKPEALRGREASLWRYREVLPDVDPVTLGEGFTPLLASREFPNVRIKDEGLNPTGSFKARGVTVAISVAKALGLKKLAMPSAGNAGSALAAYAAAAGIEAHIFMPRDVPAANRIECKKTMAYELYEQLDGKLPDAIIFPCGGGVGVIGMWKAFEEMEQLGWIDGERPRMIAVQAEGCAPLVRAWEQSRTTVEPWQDASTIAAGLRVPRPYGDYLALDILK